jgi:hypothetical protein
MTRSQTQCDDTVMIDSGEQALLDELVERMRTKYPAVPPDTVESVVHDIHARFDGRPVRDFVPLFVERRVVLALSQFNS